MLLEVSLKFERFTWVILFRVFKLRFEATFEERSLPSDIEDSWPPLGLYLLDLNSFLREIEWAIADAPSDLVSTELAACFLPSPMSEAFRVCTTSMNFLMLSLTEIYVPEFLVGRLVQSVISYRRETLLASGAPDRRVPRWFISLGLLPFPFLLGLFHWLGHAIFVGCVI